MLIAPFQYSTLNAKKWASHYWKLCNRAISRTLPGNSYTENHHVLPKCIVGNNKMFVCLKPEEHFVAHQLLVKMYPGCRKLIYAAHMMVTGSRKHQRSNNKRYAWLRKQASEASIGPNNHMYNKKHTAESNKKNSESHKGKVPWNKGIKTGIPSPKRGIKRPELSLRNVGNTWKKGVVDTVETTQRRSEAAKYRWTARKAAGFTGLSDNSSQSSVQARRNHSDGAKRMWVRRKSEMIGDRIAC